MISLKVINIKSMLRYSVKLKSIKAWYYKWEAHLGKYGKKITKIKLLRYSCVMFNIPLIMVITIELIWNIELTQTKLPTN